MAFVSNYLSYAIVYVEEGNLIRVLSILKNFGDLFLLGSPLVASLSKTTLVKNRSRWAPLVFHVKRGGINGETIMEKEILPGTHIDLIPSTIFGNDSEDNPIFVYAHIDGMDTKLWTPIDPNMIKYNAKVFLGYVEYRRPIETAFFAGSKFGRLRFLALILFFSNSSVHPVFIVC
ncbi:hypothetical protein SLA2020_065330 [Shorea laevis]